VEPSDSAATSSARSPAHEQSDHVIDDPRIKGVALTGSVEAGRSVAARAGTKLKPSSMELGGSDAFIVLDDADLEKTIPWAVWGRMYNQGQTCCASKRFIIHNARKAEFTAKLVARLGRLVQGDPQDEATTIGCLISEKAAVAVEAQVNHTVAQGAKIVLGERNYQEDPATPVSNYLARTKRHCNGGKTVDAGLWLRGHCDCRQCLLQRSIEKGQATWPSLTVLFCH